MRQAESDGPGITAVEVAFGARDKLRIDRPDGYLATLSRPGITDRQLPLKRRDLGELLSEELRRLDADQPYADALSVVTGEKDLDRRPPMRTLVWKDPARSTRKAAATTKKATTQTAKKAPKKAAKKATTTKSAAKASKAAGKKAAPRKAVARRRSS